MTTTTEKVARRKPSLLELASDLDNVSKDCKLMGYSRQQFYEIRRNFHELHFDWASSHVIAMPWLLFILSILFFSTIARLHNWSPATIGSLIITEGLGHYAFIGIPLIEALYGPAFLGWPHSVPSSTSTSRQIRSAFLRPPGSATADA